MGRIYKVDYGTVSGGGVAPSLIESESYTDATSPHTFNATSGKTYVISFAKRDVVSQSGVVVSGGTLESFNASPSYTFNSNTIYGYQIFVKATSSSVSITTGANFHNMCWQVSQLD